MDMTLVYPTNSQLISNMPLGLLSIASYIGKNSNHKCKVVDLAYYIKNQYIKKDKDIYRNCAKFLLDNFPSQVYGFSTIVTTEIPSLQISKELKALNPNIKIIFGNQWASVNDYNILKSFPQVDFIVRGEGEITMKELLDCIENKLSTSDVEGISYLHDGKIIKNVNRPRINNLDNLPSVDLSYSNPSYDKYNPSMYGGYYGILEFGRGCPFSCSFCSTTIHWNHMVSTFSVERTINDMKKLKALGFGFIEFTYDNFGTRKEEMVEFCTCILANKLDIKWSIRCRLDCLDYEIIALLKNAGCVQILVGLESGSQNVINEIGKNLNFKEAVNTIELLMNMGIKVCISYVTGLPYENYIDIYETLRMAAILKSYGNKISSTIHFHAPLPGTKDTTKALKEGKLVIDNNPYISPDFSRYLDWNNSQYENANQRLPEDELLLQQHPYLFTSYGYIVNKNVPPEIFSALSSYVNVLLQFYPLTIAVLVEIMQNDGSNFIIDFQEFTFNNGWNRNMLLKHKVEFTDDVEYGCSAKTTTLLNIFCNFVSSLNLPDVVLELLRYENILVELSQKEKNELIKSYNSTKMVDSNTVFITKGIVRSFDYNIFELIKYLRSRLYEKEKGIDWTEFIKFKSYYFFETFDQSKDVYAGVKISKISEPVYLLLRLANGKRSFKDLIVEAFSPKSNEDYIRIYNQLQTFLLNNSYLVEVI